MPTISWPQLNIKTEVPTGTTILDAALDNDIPLEHACGGFCACTTCHIKVLNGIENLSSMEEMEEERLVSTDGYDPSKSRLGCQSQVNGDIVIEIPGLQT